jgi:putative exporter of polyketide antibiotics
MAGAGLSTVLPVLAVGQWQCSTTPATAPLAWLFLSCLLFSQRLGILLPLPFRRSSYSTFTYLPVCILCHAAWYFLPAGTVLRLSVLANDRHHSGWLL